MFKNLKEAFKNKDLKTKLLITILLILCYRIGCWLPVPGIVTSVFENTVNSGDAGATFLSLLSGISGGALANGSLLALGVSPYISASIIVQLLTVAIPSLEKAAKMGLVLSMVECGRIYCDFGCSNMNDQFFNIGMGYLNNAANHGSPDAAKLIKLFRTRKSGSLFDLL